MACGFKDLINPAIGKAKNAKCSVNPLWPKPQPKVGDHHAAYVMLIAKKYPAKSSDE